MVFCKQYDPESNTLSYRGTLCLDKKSRCLGLFLKVANKLEIPEGTSFSLFLETGDYSVREIKKFCSFEQVISLHP